MGDMRQIGLLVLALLVLALAAGSVAEAAAVSDGGGEVAICLYTAHPDGSWTSPDYALGDPWPPACLWRALPGSADLAYDVACLFEDGSWAHGAGCLCEEDRGDVI